MECWFLDSDKYESPTQAAVRASGVKLRAGSHEGGSIFKTVAQYSASVAAANEPDRLA